MKPTRRERGRGKEGKEDRGRRGLHTTTPPTPPPAEPPTRHREDHPAREGEEELEPEETAEDPKEEEEGKGRDRETPRGSPVEVTCVGGGATPPEENKDLPGFHQERMHLLLQVRHTLWSGGAPLHGNIGFGMVRGSITELELRDTPRLCPHCPHEDVWLPPGP